ncbi:MAG: hypothetical protein H0U73_06365 [Tatlockia sp.]|nr:hypothetical protein [Tatlockia sp.]
MDDLRYTVKEQLKTKPENQLFSYGFIVFASVLVFGLLIFLFPGRSLMEQLINQEYISDVDYRYSIALLASKSHLPISYKDVNEDPTTVIKLLKESADSSDLQFLRLKYIVLRTISQKPNLTRAQRLEVDKALVHYLTVLKSQPNTFNQALGMAKDALAINQASLALFYAENAIQLNPQQTAFSYGELAQIALWAGQCVKSADYYFLAQKQAKLIDDKRYFFITAMKVLFQCNEFQKAIESVEEHIDGLRNDELTHGILTELAISAGKPAKAQEFVLRLLELQNSSTYVYKQETLQTRIHKQSFEILRQFKKDLFGTESNKSIKGSKALKATPQKPTAPNAPPQTPTAPKSQKAPTAAPKALSN